MLLSAALGRRFSWHSLTQETALASGRVPNGKQIGDRSYSLLTA